MVDIAPSLFTYMWKYSNIDWQICDALDISGMEYVLLDYIKHFQAYGPGWCNRTIKDMAEAIRYGKGGVHKMLTRLADRDLIEVNAENVSERRVTDKFLDLQIGGSLGEQITDDRSQSEQMRSLSEQDRSQSEQHIRSKVNNKVNNKVNAGLIEEVVDNLNSKTGSAYKAKTRKTQEVISARIKEGYTLEDFKRVISFKYSQWGNDPKLSQYLRPETLFGNKFESYLNAARLANKPTELKAVYSAPKIKPQPIKAVSDQQKKAIFSNVKFG